MEKIIDIILSIIIKCILSNISPKISEKSIEKLIGFMENRQKKYNERKEAIDEIYNCLINAIDSIPYKPEIANYYLCITEEHYLEIKEVIDKYYFYLNNGNARLCDKIMKLYRRNTNDAPTINMVYPDDSFLPAFNEKELNEIKYYTNKIKDNFRKELKL